jgi:hypothetical protein
VTLNTPLEVGKGWLVDFLSQLRDDGNVMLLLDERWLLARGQESR